MFCLTGRSSIIADTYPRLAKLDIFFLTVVAAPLGCSFPTTTWSGVELHRKFQIAICILGHQICVVLWILQITRDMLLHHHININNQIQKIAENILVETC